MDELFDPQAARRVKRLFTEFYTAFPYWREEIVELVAEGNTVAGRFVVPRPTHERLTARSAPTLPLKLPRSAGRGPSGQEICSFEL